MDMYSAPSDRDYRQPDPLGRDIIEEDPDNGAGMDDDIPEEWRTDESTCPF